MYAIRSYYDYIKPNIKELSEYCGREIRNNKEILLAAKEIISSGVQGVLVTKDKNGAVYVVITSYSIHYTKLYEPMHLA